jgi:hypothetical protein
MLSLSHRLFGSETGFMRQICVRFAALGLIFMVSAGALWIFPVVSEPLLILSGVSFLIAAGIRVKIWKDATSDPYSLTRLNQIIQEGTYDEADVPDVDHQGDKYCLCCHTVYGTQFGTCPNCAKKCS